MFLHPNTSPFSLVPYLSAAIGQSSSVRLAVAASKDIASVSLCWCYIHRLSLSARLFPQKHSSRVPPWPPLARCRRVPLAIVPEILHRTDEHGAKKQKSLSVRRLIALDGEKVLTQWNGYNQPIGDFAGLLGGFIGHIASNFNNFPIIYKTWHKVPSEYKNNVYANVVKKKFVVDDEKQKDYIISSLSKKWRDNKCRLFQSHYKPELGWEQNVNLHPNGIPKDHWASFLEHRLSAEGQALSEKNSANRKRLTVPHTLGSKTLARKKYELEIENGREYSRGEMYQISHKKKDGSFVNDEAQKKSEELEKEIEKGTSENEAYVKVFGKEHPGYVRGMGFGVCPSQVLGSSSRLGGCTNSDGPSRAEYETLKLQLKVLQDQMAFFMSQHGGQVPPGFPANQVTDLGSPVEARRSSGASYEPQSQGPSSSSNP